MELQEMVFNIAYVCIIIMLVVVLGADILRRRKLRNTSLSEEENLGETLSELPKDQFRIVKDVRVVSKLGKSRADYIIVSVYGIFAVEFRAFYILIGGHEYSQKWKKSMRFRREDFISPMWVAKVHNLAIKQALEDAGIQLPENMRWFSVAGFPNCADPSYCQLEETTSFAGKTDELVPWIESWDSEEPIFTIEEVEKIAKAIENYSEKVENMPDPEPYNMKELGLPEEYKAFTHFTDDTDYQNTRKEAALARAIKEMDEEDAESEEDENAEEERK